MDQVKRTLTSDILLASLLAATALVVYVLTLTPSLSYLSPDGNELATIPYVMGLAHSPGYPFYTWLGKVFTWLPFGDVAHRINLMSASLAAFGAGGLYLIIMNTLPASASSLGIRRAAAGLSSLLFAFSPTYWSQALIAEVYTPNIAYLTLTLLALLRWRRTQRDRDFFLFALLFGLSLGMHLSNLGFAPAFALFILLVGAPNLKRPRWWLAGISGFTLGAAQFLWLPLKAETLNDSFMLQRSPTTLQGFYNYTLGAFSQMKFAFPLSELPDRIVLYLDLLRTELSLFGILLGIIGLIFLLVRRPRRYFLYVVMYLVHIWFFIQYRVFDLEVFFLPSHLLWSIFMAVGISEALAGLSALTARFPSRKAAKAAQGFLVLLTLGMGLYPLARNWSSNDHSDDVAVNDFYTNLWEILPGSSALLTHGGVFGYDAFYWQLVYDTREDVFLPLLPSPNPTESDLRGTDLYSTISVTGPRQPRGPGTLPPDLLPRDLWQTPLLIGSSESGVPGRGSLILYHLSQEPPVLTLKQAPPGLSSQAEWGDLALIGAEISPPSLESGSRLRITLFWNISRPSRYQIQSTLGDTPLETHELGLGNLERYHREVESVVGKIIIEEYEVVIASTTAPGVYPFVIGVRGEEDQVEVANVEVVDEEETMERWLRIAGK